METRKLNQMTYLKGMNTVADVIESALALPLTDRSYVTSKLIESLERGEELKPEAVAEYDSRVVRWRAGEAQASTSEELAAKVEQILQR